MQVHTFMNMTKGIEPSKYYNMYLTLNILKIFVYCVYSIPFSYLNFP